MLLAHANGFHGRVFQPLVDVGLAADHHCVALDFRGHGDSKVPDGMHYDWEGFGDDVGAVLDDLAASAPIVGVGHSMGGAALLMAELARPGTFRGLYLFEPIVPPPGMLSPPPDNPMAAGAERRREVFDSYDAAIANYASKPPLNELRADALRAYVEHGFASQPDGTVLIKCRGATEAQIYRMAGGHATFGRLGEVACPVIIAMGQDIGMGPSAFAPSAAEAIPQGRLEVFEHLGHFGPLQAPDELAAAILAAF
jgi:pimeloyl-ACP methyl ester carboxylesterase